MEKVERSSNHGLLLLLHASRRVIKIILLPDLLPEAEMRYSIVQLISFVSKYWILNSPTRLFLS